MLYNVVMILRIDSVLRNVQLGWRTELAALPLPSRVRSVGQHFKLHFDVSVVKVSVLGRKWIFVQWQYESTSLEPGPRGWDDQMGSQTLLKVILRLSIISVGEEANSFDPH